MTLSVVALGGNALLGPGERGTALEQLANLREACAALEPLLARDGVVITHGNGPQVGNELLRQERAAAEAPPLPLYVAVAQTQAEIGTLLAAELGPVTARPVACILTRVLVDADDLAFEEPTKPVGPFYSSAEAERLEEERGWALVAEDGRGFRRVVPSPAPREVIELEAIRSLLASGTTAIACGGGGVPVVRRNGRLEGVDAVIDKDRASALLGACLGAGRLVVLTSVPALYRRFGSPDQQIVSELTVPEAERLLPELPAGSMRPKLEACAEFVRTTGGEAVITCAAALEDALAGRAGTRLAR